jgi:Mce-associated membrane protein
MVEDTQAGRAAPTWYDVLRVDRGASSEEIRAAWRESTDGATPGTDQFRVYNQAAETLLDPASRARYDAELDAEAAARAPVASERTEPEGPGDGASPEASPAPRRSRRLLGRLGAVPRWALLLLAVLVLGVIALVVLLGLRVQDEAQVADARLQAPVAAEEAAEAMLSYDYRQLPEDRARAERFLTGDFKDSYLESFTLLEEQQDGTEGPALQSQAVVQAQVMGSGVVDVSDDGREARVLVFVNQTSEKQGQDPQVFQNRVAMSLQESDGRWLVSDLRSY